MPNFTPDLSKIEPGEPSEYARKLLLEYIRQYADHLGVTQLEIALRTGFTQSNVSRILSAKYSPTMDSFIRIAGALDLHLELGPKCTENAHKSRKSSLTAATPGIRDPENTGRQQK